MTSSPARATVYCRVSSDRTNEGAGVARQREDAEALVQLRGWTLVGVHTDNDISGTGRKPRPGFDAALADIETGRADVLVAWALDRLTRNRRDELRMMEICKSRSARIALVRGADIDLGSPSGQLVAEVLGSVARHEIAAKSDRLRRATMQAAKQGRRVGGRRPFGYEPDGMTVRPDEAQAIVEGYEALLAGVPIAAIARRWNDAGFHTGQATRAGEPSRWRADSVRAVLKNPRYCGLRSYRKEVVAKAAWPALVAEETHQAAVALLSDPQRYGGGGIHGRALLTGVALCGVCGATVHGGQGNGVYKTYRCSGSYGHLARAAAPVEEYVEQNIVAWLQNPKVVRALLHRDADAPDVVNMRGEAQALRARLDESAAMFADGEITPAQFRTITQRTRDRLAEVEAAQADAGRVDIAGPLLAADDLTAAWAATEVSIRRQIIDLLAVVTIYSPGRGTRTFRPDTVDIAFRLGS